MATTQKFLDNQVGLPTLWNIIKTNFARFGFKTITDGTTSIVASAKEDTLTVEAGTNVQVALDEANKKLTFSATDTTYSPVVADSDTPGLMTGADKTKLDGIEAGAEVNQNAFANAKYGATTIAANSKTDTLEFLAGSNVQIAADGTNKTLTFSATDTTYSDVVADSTGAADSGLMTSADKAKLDQLEAGAEVNIIEVVKVNGSALTVAAADRSVDVTVTEGSVNKAISVNGQSVAVHGLGTASTEDVAASIADGGTGLATSDQVYDFATSLIVQSVDADDTTHAPSGDAVADAIAAAVSAAFIYKGSVATQEDLPASGQKTGDVYNIVAASDYGEAGMNVAWNGTAWDALGGSIIMTAMTAAEVEAICTLP